MTSPRPSHQDLSRLGARNRPLPRGRRRRRSAWPAVAGIAITVAAVIAIVALAVGSTSRRGTPTLTTAIPATANSGGIPAVESGVMPWKLPVTLSREVVEPAGGNEVALLGGLVANTNTIANVALLDTSTGTTSQNGTLPVPVHDAAGAVIGGRDVVFGGGSTNSIATVQEASAGTSGGAGNELGTLPAARSDLTSVTVGSTTYLVGGYDGTNGSTDVLATTDGRSFTTVARLSVPVRYPALAAASGNIYVFGGQSVAPGTSGAPVDAIQEIDPASHQVSVVAHLPQALAGAAAMTLGGDIYVAGGDSSAGTSSAIYAFDTSANLARRAGTLVVPVSHSGVTVVGTTAWLVGGETKGVPTAYVQMIRPDRRFGTAGQPGAGSPYFGAKLLIADRGNNRLLLLAPGDTITWSYPSATSPPNPTGFYFPDDAFFARHGTEIITNEENNQTVEILSYPSGKVLWSYGHPRQAGPAPGYLSGPDDAYVLPNGDISVADDDNCRILILSPTGTILHQLGTTDVCVHSPPTELGSPNGDTPLSDGNVLISEINGSWISEYTQSGSMVWTTTVPIVYPSDPQQIGSNLYIVADYSTPGQVIEFTRSGTVTWRYDV
ncbi:MAG: hypothetical protein ACYDD4_09630, partial [Acidimicrobiales bacterium]